MVLCNALTLNYEKSYTADVKTNRVTLDHSVNYMYIKLDLVDTPLCSFGSPLILV